MRLQKISSLSERRKHGQKARIRKILGACKGAAWGIPQDLSVEESTGHLVATSENWTFFEQLFEVFMLELPRDVDAEAALGAAMYLAGTLGSKISLRERNE